MFSSHFYVRMNMHTAWEHPGKAPVGLKPRGN